jgi:alpha-mannosidase
LVLDTVKRCEDDEDVSRGELPGKIRQGKSVVLRIYDSLGGVAHGCIETSWEVKRVWKCNMLEDDEEELVVLGAKEGEGERKVEIVLRAFEVATFRLQL